MDYSRYILVRLSDQFAFQVFDDMSEGAIHLHLIFEDARTSDHCLFRRAQVNLYNGVGQATMSPGFSSTYGAACLRVQNLARVSTLKTGFRQRAVEHSTIQRLYVYHRSHPHLRLNCSISSRNSNGSAFFGSDESTSLSAAWKRSP